MNKIYTKLKLLYSQVTGNIGFFPSLIALMGLAFAFLMLYIEEQGVSKYFIDNFPWLVINNADTARTLLSTFIGGIISLMVFSFSMVMLLLNQASNNYSPRILPGLISNKKHQYVLGFYIAVIIYCIIILLSIVPTDDKHQLPGFAVLVGIILSIHVLAAFIYFIHSISQAIQINNITDRIFGAARKRLQTLIDKENEVEGLDIFDDVSDWHGYKSTSSGYLNDIAFDSLSKLAKDQDISIKMLVSKGEFVLVDVPIVKVNKELDEENQDMLQSCFGFSRSEIVKLNYVLGFKQLTEIAVKAMSPGINDPGTAITCIDYLTELFALRMLKKDNSYVVNDDNKAVVSLDTVDFDELIYYIFASLRQYCKADFIMMTKMLTSLYYLKNVETIDDSYKKVINTQAQLILEDAQAFIKNETDLKNLKEFTQKFK
ncbi:DUF2254 domain-containing protein [Dokdonia sp. Dokd-P16]|uniref:DUF2254 domain-containing protein n=1 Tax=Dokdonia sp. Dokd-P16 TaxID=2173169 RepID=UPI000D54A911|nr:DUF2254 domain-containing protein [Dokdonia sp. Dokd-P16]AWH74994.1 DUF2254 domain-containing protein [Dokdonia sp. Dokd-P16]